MFDISELESFADELNDMANGFKIDLEKEVNKQGNKLLRRTKQKTPVAESNGGILRRSWKLKKISSEEIMVLNNVEYAHHVEYGHRTRLGKGTSKNYKPKMGGISKVPGRFMLKRSVEEVSRGLDKSLEILIKNTFKK